MGGPTSEPVVTTAMSGHVASNDIRAEHATRTGGGGSDRGRKVCEAIYFGEGGITAIA